MDLNAVIALAAFALVTSITPGPNNLMLMASGANFGLRRTLPHIAGVGLGFLIILMLIGVGLGRLLQTWPMLQEVLRLACLAYLGLLAWRIATAPPPGDVRAGSRPLTFLQAALFQWVNPKGWAMALTTVSTYALSEGVRGLVFTGAVFGVVNVSSVSSWALAGTWIRQLLTGPTRVRAFNLTMAVLLLASVAPLLMD